MISSTDERKNIFICYSHKDSRYLDDLRKHLHPYTQANELTFWDDTRITPGTEWYTEIKRALDSAKVAILLVSADFLASDFISTRELPSLLENAAKGEVILIPIILSFSNYNHTALSEFQAINNPSTPLNQMSRANREKVWTDVAKRVIEILAPARTRDQTSGPQMDSQTSPIPITTLYTYQGHTERVNAVAWSPDGKRLASASDDKTVQIWDAVTGRRITTYKGHSSFVLALAWSPDGQYIASAGDDKTMQIWQVTTKRRLFSFSHSKAIASLAWAPDGKSIAFASIDIWPNMSEEDVIQVLDISTQKVLLTHPTHFRTTASLGWSPDGKFIASANYNGMEVITTSGDIILSSDKENSAQVNTVAWSPNGNYIASAGEDRAVQIWDITRRSIIPAYQGHSGSISTLAWSPDGKYIASAGEGQTVQIWDVATKTCTWTYYGHSAAVLAVAWSPDGQHIASAGQDKTVQIWQVEELSKEF